MKKNKLLSYIVGILFGILFSIPWVLVYTFLKLSIGYLTILIVLGLIIGYKIIEKNIYNTKKTKLYLVLSSLFIILINVLLIMPMLIQILAQGTVTANFLRELYSTKSMIIAFLIDLTLAIIMVLIPALVLPIDFKLDENHKSEGEEFLDKVEKVFEKYNAFSKETAVNKKIIKEELNKIELNGFKKFWYTDFLKGLRIKSTKGKWYFKKKNNNFKFGLLLSILLLIVFANVWNLVFLTVGKDVKDNVINDVKEELKEKTKNIEYNISNKIKIKMPECMTYYEDEFDDSNGFDIYYYQYVSSNTSKSDLEAIQIYFYDNYNINDYYGDYDTFKNEINNTMNEYEIIETGNIKFNNYTGFYNVYNKMDQTRTTIGYYIPINNGLIQIYAYLNKDNYNLESKTLSDNIAKSLMIN